MKGTVLKITARTLSSISGTSLKASFLSLSSSIQRATHRRDRRRHRCAAGRHGRLRRPHRAVQGKGREGQDLGRRRTSAYNEEPHHSRPRHRTHQRRTVRGHRRPRVSAGFADRCPARQESRFPEGQGNRMPGHQAEPQAGQHRAVAQDRARKRAGAQERPSRWKCCERMRKFAEP